MTRAWALVLAAVAVASAGAQTPPRFTSKTESVRVDVLATSGDTPVRGLTAADFEVRDNGVPQTITVSTWERAPVSVAIALDTSASLSPERLNALRAASRALVAKLRDGDTVGVTTFSHVIRPAALLPPGNADLEQALMRPLEPGHTALVDAAFAGMTLAEEAPGRGLLVIFSDGVDTASWLEPADVVRAARRGETVVYGVSTGEGTRTRFLTDMADATAGQVLTVRASNLDAAFTRIVDEFRQRYLLSYEPQGVPRGGWHRIEVKVKRRGVTVRTRPGYFDR